MNKDEYKISLSNCNFNKKRLRLTSPFSLRACELIGIDEEELLYIPKEEYLAKNPDCQTISKELQDERYNHYNARRLRLIKEAKAKRAELIKLSSDLLSRKKSELDSNLNNNMFGLSTLYNRNDLLKKSSSAIQMGNTFNNGSTSNSTAIKIGKEKLRKIKERQELNIKLQIDYECALEENRRNNIKKMKLKEEKEERMKMEKNYQLMLKLKKEEQKERRRKMKEDEHNHQMELRRIENEKKDMIKMQKEEKRKEEEEKERKKQFEEQQRKEKKFREKVEQMNQMKFNKLLEKQKELDERDIKRKINMEKMKDETQRKMSEKTKIMQNKIKKALMRNEFMMNEKITLYLERQKKLEELKEQKDKEKEFELYKQTLESKRRSEKRKSIFNKNIELVKQKIEKYNHKMEILKERQEKRHLQEIQTIEEEIGIQPHDYSLVQINSYQTEGTCKDCGKKIKFNHPTVVNVWFEKRNSDQYSPSPPEYNPIGSVINVWVQEVNGDKDYNRIIFEVSDPELLELPKIVEVDDIHELKVIGKGRVEFTYYAKYNQSLRKSFSINLG